MGMLERAWRNGTEAWVLVHVEVQAQATAEFAERMFVYNYRIYDRYRRPVASFAVLGDDRPGWRPTEYSYNLWDSETRLRFRVAKLLDYAETATMLEGHDNPFALVVLGHLQALSTRDNPQNRCAWKIRLVKGLLNRGLEAEAIRQLFKMIDWMMDLSEELTKEFEQTIYDFEKEKQMPYITSIERRALQRGREEGREKGREEGVKVMRDAIAFGLEHRFGGAGAALVVRIAEITDLGRLRAIHKELFKANSIEELQTHLGELP